MSSLLQPVPNFIDANFLVGVFGTFAVTTLAFWGFNLFLLLLDLSNGPTAQWIRRYKIQETKNVPLDVMKLKSAMMVVLFNQIVVSIPTFICLYPLLKWRGVSHRGPLPSIPTFIYQLCCCVLIEEFCFYYSHRLLHSPFLYKHIHKLHHEWTAPIGIIGIYAHPIEHIVSNLFPPFIGIFLLGTHLFTAWIWFSIALIFTSISHSGYHFPFFPSPEAHDYHHAKFDNCYGVLGILDFIHQTDLKFRKSDEYKRHYIYTNVSPLKDWLSLPSSNNPKTNKIAATLHSATKRLENSYNIRNAGDETYEKCYKGEDFFNKMIQDEDEIVSNINSLNSTSTSPFNLKGEGVKDDINENNYNYNNNDDECMIKEMMKLHASSIPQRRLCSTR